MSPIDRLDDSNISVREWAVRTLGALGDERAVEPLLRRHTEDPSESVREWVGRALNKIRARQSHESRMSVLDPSASTNVRVRERPRAGAPEGGSDRQDSGEILSTIDALDDESARVRVAAARALGGFGDQYEWARVQSRGVRSAIPRDGLARRPRREGNGFRTGWITRRELEQPARRRHGVARSPVHMAGEERRRGWSGEAHDRDRGRA